MAWDEFREWVKNWLIALVPAFLFQFFMLVLYFLCLKTCDPLSCSGCKFLPFFPAILLLRPLLLNSSGVLAVIFLGFAVFLNIVGIAGLIAPIVDVIRRFMGSRDGINEHAAQHAEGKALLENEMKTVSQERKIEELR